MTNISITTNNIKTDKEEVLKAKNITSNLEQTAFENKNSLSENIKKKLNRATLKAHLHNLFKPSNNVKTDANESTSFASKQSQFVYPYLSNILNIPLKFVDNDDMISFVLLNAINIQITDSSLEQIESENNESNSNSETLTHNRNDTFVFRIELKYANIKWTVNRRLYDFIKLHSLLKLRNYASRMPKAPKFPDIVSYAFHRAKLTDNNNDEKLRRLARERRLALENYLNKVLQRYTLRNSNELCQFLEICNLSFSRNMGWKGREGYIEVNIDQNINSIIGCCYPLVMFKSKWQDMWLIIRDSYIAFCERIEDINYTDVFLFNNKTKITKKKESVNPLKSYALIVSDNKKNIEIRTDNDDVMDEWKMQLSFAVKKSKYTNKQRFNAFAPVRSNVFCTWFVDGADFFYTLSEAIMQAKHTIYILNWWLSPEFYLRRPPQLHESYRIDRLLKHKAMQGVNIYIIVYKEVTISLPINSNHTKTRLKNLHPLIKVQRHPDHVQNATLFWAHHEKLTIIDKETVFMGGLDTCFGRFDNNAHVLTDYSPSLDYKIIWPGQDYSNPRINDFSDVHKYWTDSVDRQNFPRMGWHDIALRTEGKVAKDLSRHFVQRWNFIKSIKARNRARIPYLIPEAEYLNNTNKNAQKGTCRIQVLRSCAEWSNGIAKEHSIYNAYIKLILEANHFIYIENQFFVSLATDDKSYRVKNQVAKAIVDRIKQAHEEQKRFKVIIIIPLLPAFANELSTNNAYTIKLIMHYQYFSICRGNNSIMQQLKKVGIDPNEYISFHGLRNYDLIPESHFKKDSLNQGRNTNLLYDNLDNNMQNNARNQYACSLVSLDDKSSSSDSDEDYNKSTRPLYRRSLFFNTSKPVRNKNKKTIQHDNLLHKPSLSMHDISLLKNKLNSQKGNNNLSNNQSSSAMYQNSTLATNLKTLNNTNKEENIMKSETDLLNNNTKTSTVLEKNKQSEEMQYVTEEIYVHSKLMIVDDLKVILGSANINDRSMLGNRDSEIALCIEDTDLIDSTINNKPCKVSRYAHSLRMNLCLEHLGLLKGLSMTNIISERLNGLSKSKNNSKNDHFIEEIHKLSEKFKNEKNECLVKDPLNDQFIELWGQTSKLNTEIFREVFHCIPDDTVKTWDYYKKFIPENNTSYAHPVNKDKVSELKNIKGHLVDFPLEFLENEALDSAVFTAESFAPVDIFT